MLISIYSLIPTLPTAALQPSAAPPPAGPPAYTLISAHTVVDVWREYKEGIAGGPAVEQLERQWQSRWRPAAAQRTAWSRRKTVIDEVQRLIAAGLAPADAVAELEAQRGSSTLRSLIDSLVERKRQPGQRRHAGRPPKGSIAVGQELGA
jgi:Transcriptional activator of glycolytic enzymes